MDFEICHPFEMPPEEVAAALLDQDFQRSLTKVGQLEDRALLSQDAGRDGTVVRRTRCVLQLQPTGLARRFLGDAAPAWVEEATWDPHEMRWSWKIVPEVARELLDAGGSIRVEPDGSGSRRCVTGRVSVHVPFYGGRVEQWIRDGLEQAYDEEAQLLRAWLKA